MNIGRKYREYLKEFPIDIQWRIGLTKDPEGFTRDNTMYFGPRLGSMKNGSYGICFQMNSSGCLVVREGQWKHDRFSGKGSTYYIPRAANGENMIIVWKEGEWIEDELCGKGVIREFHLQHSKWTTRYAGEFQQGYRHGHGVAYYGDFKYQGHFEHDNFQGHGRLTISPHNFYDGQFLHGRPYGRGLERRDTEIVVSTDNNKEVYSAPEEPEKLANFYTTLIDQI